MNLFQQIEGWMKRPWQNDIPLGALFLLGVLFVIVCIWASDSLRLLKKGLG